MDVTIERNGFRLILLPGLGGSIRSFTWRGRDILFPAPAPPPSSPLETAGFPLFPFSGRIDHGRFPWNGRDIRLTPNFPPEPHTIHGQAWLGEWSVEEIDAHSAHLTYHHEAGQWPWTYRAGQRFELHESGMKLRLELTNLSENAMPAGLGWHPYFPRGDAQLSAQVSGIWVADTGMIPDRVAPLGAGSDIRALYPVSDLDLDNAFTATPANAEIAWPSHGLRMTIESSPELNHLVVYTPPGRDFFCVEPVSHAPNAVNSAYGSDITGLRTLASGETLSASIVLTVRQNNF